MKRAWKPEYNFPMAYGCTIDQAYHYIKWIMRIGYEQNGLSLDYFMANIWKDELQDED
jgi:hypothetical protein